MTIAEKPSVIIISLKKGTASTVSRPWVTGFFASSLLKKTNNKNAILQINANLEKKEITFNLLD
jgi:hypothetical protein